MPLSVPYKLQVRSMDLKLIIVSVLAVLMTIPALFVYLLVEDRSQRAAEVSKSIGSEVGRSQALLGPVLAVPYAMPDTQGDKRMDHGVYLIFPAEGDTDVVMRSEVRHRSLFKVPVYAATVHFVASWPTRP